MPGLHKAIPGFFNTAFCKKRPAWWGVFVVTEEGNDRGAMLSGKSECARRQHPVREGRGIKKPRSPFLVIAVSL
jgi:hypothetical protein